ncbi:MAG: phospho-N-acetylmuramoyl-pentapeptide-transferase [Clostridiales bacterium]|nr:phospho-N-acetylmuramoyl-pentapeptide-transferase [Clostridiales bacterium]
MEWFINMTEQTAGTLWSCFLPLIISFAVAAVLGPVVIPWLAKLKFGQQILEIGPNWHKKKAGTPTMGGMIFIAGVIAAMTVRLIIKFDITLLMMLVISCGFGLIGFIDDYIKVVKKRNLGLTAKQKFALQAILAVIYIIVLKETGNLDTHIIVPFVSKTLVLPWWLYIVFTLFVVCGTVNAVNLTDGLDGLAASITCVVALFFGVCAVLAESSVALYFSMALLGGCLAFLIFNHYPAKVFMGDTGSLFLGGCISVLAVGLKMPLILIIAGFVYLFETLSVIMQVASFKLTGKRIFKMAPIHHHFEMCGWKERKIVAVFTAVTVILCVIALWSVTPCLGI